jgi:hypothetical protein
MSQLTLCTWNGLVSTCVHVDDIDFARELEALQ